MILLLLTDGVVGALLTGGGEVDVRGLIPIQALMSPNDGKVEEGDGQARETTHVHFVGGLACSGAQGVVVAALHVRKLDVLVSLVLVLVHSKHQSHFVIDALDNVVGAGVVGAGGDLVDA